MKNHNKDQFFQLFVDELRDIYSAENQLLVALPKMAKSAFDEELRDAFLNHLEETKNQVQRLDKIFKQIQERPEGETCEAMQGLIKEGSEVDEKYEKSAIRDAALIAAAQRVEHYEMAVYGTLRTFANQLDYDEAADLLQETLNEEGNANKKLTKIAEGGIFTSGVNKKAAKK